MPHATLFVNPAAGGASALHALLASLKTLLAAHGYTSETIATVPGQIATQARTAARRSALVLACGGDGTVHDVLQGVADTDAALGVLPLGTANVLARTLDLPLDPIAALARLLTYTPRSIPLGRIVTLTRTEFFAVMAGCGPDGALAHTHARRTTLKARFGRHAYYAQAAQLFLTRRWPAFQIEFRTAAGWRTREAVAVMAARVPDLGGAFSGLTPLARLTSPTLHLKVLAGPAHLTLPTWFALSRLGLPNPWVTTVDVQELRCTPLLNRQVLAQADAEPMGALPVTLDVVPDAVRLLMPGL